jgi:Tol biopolymer transport system component
MFAREYSLYMACADGSAEQEIVPAESWLPDASYFLRSFALSPDGEKVAVSGNPTDPDLTAGLFVIQLADGSVTQLHHAEGYVIDYVSWSPDGEYIGYMATPGYYDRLEVLHVESRTISQVATAESISGKANWVVNILSFDWSPRGTQIVYVAFLDGRPPEVNGYIADIDCTSSDHICKGSNQQMLPWEKAPPLTWTPDGLSLSTGYAEYAETPEVSILEIRRLSGELLRRIDLTDLLPGMQIAYGSETALSPDGNRIAFFMEGDKGGGLFVLNLSTLETTRVARRVNPVGIQWVPGK